MPPITTNSILGTPNDDILADEVGDDLIRGYAGDDIIIGLDGSNDIDAGAGNDIVFGGIGDDLIVSGSGDDAVFGSDGNDQIEGNSGADSLHGDAGADVIRGGGDDDFIAGGDGADHLRGEEGADEIYGDNNNDIIFGGKGDDDLYGGAGVDIIYGNDDADLIRGDDGDDYLSGDAGNDDIRGGAGNDLIRGGDGDDAAYGDEGDDIIYGNDGADRLHGGAGNDRVRGGAGNDYIRGNDGADDLRGDAGDDVIKGDDGEDNISGGSGNDLIYGDGDNDRLSGGAGDDRMRGGEGNDYIRGNEGNDDLRGEDGDDVIKGDEGQDNISGGSGNDLIYGGADDDRLSGGSGDDRLRGGDGEDYIRGNDGDDGLRGNAGDDVLKGDAGEDNLSGGSGDDQIYGGADNDHLTGGAGDDRLSGGDGDDKFTYILVDNISAADVHIGGADVDALILSLTSAEWANVDIQADIHAFESYLAANIDSSTGEINGSSYHFSQFGLTVSSIEKMKLLVDGIVTNPNQTNAAPNAAPVNGSAVENGGQVTITAQFTDPDDDTHSFTIDSAGTLGVVVDNGDGTFAYNPNGAFESLAAGETTTDTFSYTVYDAHGGADTATVTMAITGTNDAPTIGIISAAQSSGDAPFVLSATITDVDASDVHVVSIDTTGTLGTITNNGDGTFSYDQDGVFSSLAPGQVATDTFSYTVDDGHGGTNTQTANIAITGALPEEPSLEFLGPLVQEGGEFLVNTRNEGGQAFPTITGLDGGGFVVTWSTDNPIDDGHSNAIKAQMYDEAGNALGDEFLVNTQFSGPQVIPDIASLVGGGFVITWQGPDPYDHTVQAAAKAQIFDSTGNAVGSEFGFNDENVFYQFSPKVGGLVDGGFVITWIVDHSIDDGSDYAIKAQVFNASGGLVGDEFLVNSQHAGRQNEQAITGLEGGGFVISWTTPETNNDGSISAVKAQVYDAVGEQIGGEFLINTQNSGIQRQSTITSLDDGGFVVSWMTITSNDEGSSYAIKAQIYDALAAPVGNEFLVNSQPSSGHYSPIITSLDNGGFVIIWQSNDEGDKTIKAQEYNGLGDAVGEELLVADGIVLSTNNAHVANLSGDGFVVAWHDKETIDSFWIKAQIYRASEDGNFIDGETSNFGIIAELHPNHAADTLGDVTISGVPSAATFSQGTNNGDGTWTLSQDQLKGLQVTFESNYSGDFDLGISVTSTDENGIETTRTIAVSTVVTDVDHAPEFADETTLEVTINEGTTAVATAEAVDLDGDAISYSLSGDDALLFNVDANGVVTFNNAPNHSIPADVGADNIYNLNLVATDSGNLSTTKNIVVTVAEFAEPSLELVGLNLQSGTEFLVNSGHVSAQYDPSISGLDGGGFIATWTTDNFTDDNSAQAVKAQMFDAEGGLVGTEFLVNSQHTASQYDPIVTGLDGGGFIITWRTNNYDDDGNKFAIKAQLFDAAGDPVAGEFLVNSLHYSYQFTPVATGLDGGGFVITWQTASAGDDGHGPAIKAQIYDAAGNTVGSEFLVNSEHAGNQLEPTISGLVGGGFVIVWTTRNGSQDNDGWAIKAQLYDAAGDLVDGEFLVNSQHIDNQHVPTVSSLDNGGFVIAWQTENELDDTHGAAVKAQIYDGSAAPVGLEFLVNSQVFSHQVTPSITGLSDGSFVVVWTTGDANADGSGSAIKAQLYDETGSAIGDEFLVNDGHAGEQYEPIVAALDDGSFVVTWTTHNSLDDGSGSAVKAKIFKLENGHSFADGEIANFNILTALHPNHLSDTLGDVTISGVPNEATFSQGTNNGDGTWTISQAQLTGLQITFDGDYSGSFNFGLTVTSTDGNGVESTTNILVPVAVVDVAHLPEFTADTALAINVNEGQTAVTTLTATDLDGEVLDYTLTGADHALFEVNANGVITFADIPDFDTPLDVGGDNVYNITLNAADANDTAVRDVVITVDDFDEPTLEFLSFGTPTSDEFLVNSQHIDYQYSPTMVGLNAGGFVIIWVTSDGAADGSGSALKAQMYDMAGVASGGEFLVNSESDSSQSEPSVAALTSGGFVISWSTADINADGSGSAIKTQIYDASGNPVGNETLVNTEHENFQNSPAIAGLIDGGFVISWTTTDVNGDGSGSSIKAQMYNATGGLVGSEFLVNSQHTAAQYLPSITGLDNGGFVITWRTDNTNDDGSGSAIKAQIYDALGGSIGGELLINSQFTSVQQFPTIVGLNGGGFVITWHTNNTNDDGSGSAIKAQIFNDTGGKVGVEFLINSQLAGNQLLPEVASLSNGGFVVTWYTTSVDGDGNSGAVKAQIFDESGLAVGEELLLNNLHFGDQFGPIVTGLIDGGFSTSWQTSNTNDDGSGSAIKARIYHPTDKAHYYDNEISDFNIIAQLHPSHLSDTLGDVTISGVPSEATFNQGTNNGDGTWTISQAQLTGLQITFDGDYSGNLNFGLSVTSTDSIGGETTTNIIVPVVVSDIAHAPEFTDDTVLNLNVSEGHAAVTTLAASDLDGDLLNYTLSGDDGNLFDVDANGVITFTDAPDFETPLDMGADNIYNITLNAADATSTASRDVVINVGDIDEPSISISNSFHATGGEFLVNSQHFSNQFQPAITTLEDGGFVITWHTTNSGDDGSGFAVKAQMYDADGGAIGGEFLVNSEHDFSQRGQAVSGLKGGGFVISWYTENVADDGSGAAIKAQIYDVSGGVVGGEFLVNTLHLSDQYLPTIAPLNDGGFVITWRTNGGEDGSGTAIKAQIHNASGGIVISEFLVNSQHHDHQFEPVVASLTNGGFVITWQTASALEDGSGAAIKAQMYDATGSAIGGEFLINSEHANSQFSPTITGLNNGGFVITWFTTNSGDDGSHGAIKAQIYNASGAPIGGEFLVNSEYENHQYEPSITGLSDGGFVITWYTQNFSDDGNGTAIKARIYDATGAAMGEEFLVNSQHLTNQYEPRITALEDGGFVITWYSFYSGDDGSGSSVKAQMYQSSAEGHYNDGESYVFNINTQLHPDGLADTLGDVTISGVPVEITFSHGINNGDGTWTVEQSQLEGLQITFAGGFNGALELELSVTSTDISAAQTTSTIFVPISVGNSIMGTASADVVMATSGIDHVQLGEGVDQFVETGFMGDYTFAVVGDNLQLTHVTDGATNTDLLNSVEILEFTNTVGTIDVANLHVNGHIADMTSAEYDFWLSHNFDYDTSLV
ncbi:MAG: Ig-like domain-containing protein [Hyphomicrobiales bacterium]